MPKLISEVYFPFVKEEELFLFCYKLVTSLGEKVSPEMAGNFINHAKVKTSNLSFLSYP